MDASRAQFLILVGEIGYSAQLAGLQVDVTTGDGVVHTGLPLPRVPHGDEVDATGLAHEFRVGNDVLDLDDIVEVRVRCGL